MKFKVIAVSLSTNSFGLKSMIVAKPSREVWQICANEQHVLPVDSVITVHHKDIALGFANLGYEMPKQLPNMPADMIKTLFPENSRIAHPSKVKP